MRNERQRINSAPFQKMLCVDLSEEDIKSKMNCVLGWAVKSERSKTKDKASDKYKILNSMACYEKDINKKDMMDRCDLITLLRNKGGEGGFCLAIEAYFVWENK